MQILFDRDDSYAATDIVFMGSHQIQKPPTIIVRASLSCYSHPYSRILHHCIDVFSPRDDFAVVECLWLPSCTGCRLVSMRGIRDTLLDVHTSALLRAIDRHWQSHSRLSAWMRSPQTYINRLGRHSANHPRSIIVSMLENMLKATYRAVQAWGGSYAKGWFALSEVREMNWTTLLALN